MLQWKSIELPDDNGTAHWAHLDTPSGHYSLGVYPWDGQFGWSVTKYYTTHSEKGFGYKHQEMIASGSAATVAGAKLAAENAFFPKQERVSVDKDA